MWTLDNYVAENKAVQIYFYIKILLKFKKHAYNTNCWKAG